MDESELHNVVTNLYRQAENYVQNTQVESERETTLRYYQSKPYGDEREGMSSFVSAEVLETVNWLLPGVNKKFQYGKKAVEFDATHDTDGAGGDPLRDFILGKVSEEQAEDATVYVNHVYYEENEGFKHFEAVSWDGMVSKTGIMKHYWREREVQTFQRIFEQDPVAVEMRFDPDELPDHIQAEYTVLREYEAADGSPQIDIEVKRTATVQGTQIDVVAPEDFLVLPGDDFVHDEMRGCFERIRKTRGEWIAEGLDEALVMEIPANSTETEELTVIRENTSTTGIAGGSVDPMQEEVLCIECYLMYDLDGDGVPERIRVLPGGEGGQVFIEAEPYDGVPYTDFCPFRVPHTFYGDCPADRVADLQRLTSELLRQSLDYGVEVNTPTVAIGEGGERSDGSTMIDLLDRSTGGAIRVADVGQITWNRPPDPSQLNQQLMQWAKQKTVARTGASEVQPASDPNSLQPGSATETLDRRQASDEIKDYIAASYADSLGRVFKKILYLEVLHADRPKTIKVGKEFRTIDPRTLPRELNVRVNVGLGSGSKNATIAYLAGVKENQTDLVDRYGWADENPGRGFVTKSQYFNTCRDMVRAMGFDDPDRYYSDPTGKGEFQIPPEVLAQVQMQAQQEAAQSVLVQLEKYKVDTEAQVDMAKIRADLEKAMMQTGQRDTESRRETAQKEADSRRDADTKRFTVVEEQATERQEIAANVAYGMNSRNSA